MQGRSVESIIRAKNRELRSERERTQALEITNTIISAYLSLLVERSGGVRIPKKAVSEALGNFVTNAHADGDDYVITVARTVRDGNENDLANRERGGEGFISDKKREQHCQNSDGCEDSESDVVECEENNSEGDGGE